MCEKSVSVRASECVCVCSDLSVDCVQDSVLQSGDGGDSRRSRQ